MKRWHVIAGGWLLLIGWPIMAHAQQQPCGNAVADTIKQAAQEVDVIWDRLTKEELAVPQTLHIDERLRRIRKIQAEKEPVRAGWKQHAAC